ncbi:hypothetical protein EAG_14135 [Camponotus floridanus]|uniref:Uncharacterized protein n=1 Tax=Camponotus floridanus TaxID=104421 RepID=E1ZXD3_CAMFO|nr:hypothetical protein EAG_14135 [Camponotus floridanus]
MIGWNSESSVLRKRSHGPRTVLPRSASFPAGGTSDFQNKQRGARMWLKVLRQNITHLARRAKGHLIRMPQDRAVKKIFQLKMLGTRRRGRPRERWLDSMVGDLKKNDEHQKLEKSGRRSGRMAGDCNASSVEQKNGNGNVKGNKTNNNGVEVNRNEDQNGGVDAKGQAKKKPTAPGGGPLLQQA